MKSVEIFGKPIALSVDDEQREPLCDHAAGVVKELGGDFDAYVCLACKRRVWVTEAGNVI